LAQWKTHFFDPIQRDSTKLTGAILRLIEHRRNDVIDQTLPPVKKPVDSFGSVCSDSTDPDGEYLNRDNNSSETQVIEVNDQCVKKVVDSFVSIGFSDADPNQECLDLYKQHFETPFFEATDHYYKESLTLLPKNTISEYLREAEGWLKKENRIKAYLHTETTEELDRKQAELILDNVQNCLDFDQEKDLQSVHALLPRTP
jgi:cullin 1